MASEAFDLAEQLQTPVFVMSDLDLGMNNWMSDPFAYPDKPIKRGKVLEPSRRPGALAASRATRTSTATAIGVSHAAGNRSSSAAWFARGSGHNEKVQYSERPDDYANNMDRLARKFETARTLVPKPELVRDDGNEIGIIAYGTTHHALVETLDQLQNEYGVKVDYLRLRAYPFTARDARVHCRAQARVRHRPEPRRADAASC